MFQCSTKIFVLQLKYKRSSCVIKYLYIFFSTNNKFKVLLHLVALCYQVPHKTVHTPTRFRRCLENIYQYGIDYAYIFLCFSPLYCFTETYRKDVQDYFLFFTSSPFCMCIFCISYASTLLHTYYIFYVIAESFDDRTVSMASRLY